MDMRFIKTVLLAAAGIATLLVAEPQAQVRTLRGTGAIREKPPGELATIQRRDPDFTSVRFIALQRDFRGDMRGKLMLGHAVIRPGRPVAPMPTIDWPPPPPE